MATPMFPLGSVLFPTQALPLHVFESRYRVMMHDLLAGDGRFGVCLIERGSEVGGGERRVDVGTLAEIREHEELPDGRWVLVAVGTERIRVTEWLDDDPYPRADTVAHPDPQPSTAELDLLPSVTERLRSALAMAAALGRARASAEFRLSDDPVVASHQASALAPVGVADQQSLLAAPTVGLRLALLDGVLRETCAQFELELGGRGS